MLSSGRHSRWRVAGMVIAVVAVASSCTQYESRRPPWGHQAQRTGDWHKVAVGDQLGQLARAYGVSLAALAQANDVSPPYTIYVGQDLRIPSRGNPVAVVEVTMVEQPAAIVQPAAVETESVAATTLAVPEETAAPTQQAAAAPTVTRHVVVRGDNLLAIAQRFQVHPNDLAAANGLHPPYEVWVGQALRIPGSAERRTLPPASRQVASRPTAEPSQKVVLGAPPPIGEEGFLWPVRGKIVEAFGQTGDGPRADGITIAARKGTPVLAAESGVVAFAGEGVRAYGLMLLIRHDDDYITTYAHNSVLLVAEGDVVRRGQAIARVGNTGDTMRSQLHFELRKGRKPIDPERVLVTEPTAVASSE